MKVTDGYYQEITIEQAKWIEDNFPEFDTKEKFGIKELNTRYFKDNDNFFKLDKDQTNEYVFVFTVRKLNGKFSVRMHSIFFDNSGKPTHRDEKQPRRIVERVMRHYPPHTNIYEREMTKNSMIKLDSELKRKDEEPVKIKRNKL